VVECLLNKHKALSLNPSIARKKKERNMEPADHGLKPLKLRVKGSPSSLSCFCSVAVVCFLLVSLIVYLLYFVTATTVWLMTGKYK
jgi:hypothetical protein